MKVSLRKRKGKKETTLYIDAYMGKEKERIYEKLPFRLLNDPQTPFERRRNKENQEKAEMYLVRRRQEIENELLGIPTYRPNANFLHYAQQFAEKEFNRKASGFKFHAVLEHLIQFLGAEKLRFRDVTEDFCRDFMQYLKNDAVVKRSGKGLHQNTAAVYFRKFKRILHTAFREGIIPVNPVANIEGIKDVKTERQFLELDELQKVVSSASWRESAIKRAFIFSCYTGLRLGDLCALKWSQIKNAASKGWYLEFTASKTKQFDRLYLADHVFDLIGPKSKDDELVFAGLKKLHAAQIPPWVKRCGVDKHITFHGARHTNATLLLSMGADLYTVSQVLGHSNLATTQIYLHTLDEKVLAASRLIPDLVSR